MEGLGVGVNQEEGGHPARARPERSHARVELYFTTSAFCFFIPNYDMALSNIHLSYEKHPLLQMVITQAMAFELCVRLLVLTFQVGSSFFVGEQRKSTESHPHPPREPPRPHRAVLHNVRVLFLM